MGLNPLNVVASAFSGAVGLPGMMLGMGGDALQYFGAREQRKADQASAREQMMFQERMSNTAYRRAMEDMKAAGLNPMLAFAQGGATTPSGAKWDPENMLEAPVSNSLELARLKKDVEEAASRIGLNKETEKTQKSQQRLNDASVEAMTEVTKGREFDNERKESLGRMWRLLNKIGDKLNPKGWRDVGDSLERQNRAVEQGIFPWELKK